MKLDASTILLSLIAQHPQWFRYNGSCEMDLIALLVSSLAAAFERYAMQFYMPTISCDVDVTFFNGPKNELLLVCELMNHLRWAPH